MTALELIGAPRSVFVRATRLALEEKGVPYRLNAVAPHTPEILSVNPFGRIPGMRHGDVVLFESLAIMIYVDRVFDGLKLLPDDAQHAARIVQWASAISANVFPALVHYMQANAFPSGPHGTRDLGLIERLLPQVNAQLGILDAAIAEAGHLVGDSFTPADMYLMPMLAYLNVFPESAAMLAGSGNLTRYFETHAVRASFRATAP
jgi:glutathione S-transferase